MKNINFLFFYVLFITEILTAQTNNKVLFQNTFISLESNYRSYGTGDIIGLGVGFELSKDIVNWLGVGINVSYWSNQRLSWDFYDPFTNINFQYYDQINELKFSPFVQFIPLNTKYFDFYIQTGLRMGHYNQIFYGGGYDTDLSYDPPRVFSYITDMGTKGFNIGYEFGFALRFQFDNIIVVPNLIYSNDNNANDFSSINLKVGWNLN